MFAQYHTAEQKSRLSWRYNQKLGLSQKISFVTLNQNFKFKQVVTLNKNKNLHLIHGQLVYNNGGTVSISISHQNLFDRTLNREFEGTIQKLVYAIQTRQTLIFSGKVIGLPAQMCDLWIKECENQVLSKKRRIIHLLAAVGFQMDNQNELMKKIIFEKRCLKQKLDQLIGKTTKQKTKHTTEQEMINEESNVIFFGPHQEIDIQPERPKPTQEDKTIYLNQSKPTTENKQGNILSLNESKTTPEEKQGKRVEGGYFTIQIQQYVMRNTTTQQKEKVVLCRKTLRSKKKIQENAREMNQRKMKKEIEIVKSIKNNKYLIKYYCKRDLNKLEEVLMEKYDYSLQQYINYFADSLEIQHKILIAQQIVQAVIILHSSGVVHRDIKPSNFLISDDINNPNYYQIKIIDFAESYSQNISFYEGDYACSHPYSPLECSQLKSNSTQRIQEGIKNKEIDYWSVGMIVYQVFFRKLPLSFSRVFHLDIAASWKSQLLLTVNQRQKYGLAVVQDIITILCVKMLKIEQQKRMKLETAMGILNLLEEYVKNIFKIVQEAS